MFDSFISLYQKKLVICHRDKNGRWVSVVKHSDNGTMVVGRGGDMMGWLVNPATSDEFGRKF